MKMLAYYIISKWPFWALTKAEHDYESTHSAKRLSLFSFVQIDYWIPTDETIEQLTVKQALEQRKIHSSLQLL